MEVNKIPILGGIKQYLEGEDIDYGKALVVIGLLLILGTFWFFDVSETRVVSVLLLSAPIWLPFVTFMLMFEKWMQMAGMKFTIKSGRTIFEIVLPPEVYKSPEAMEFVFTQIYNKASPDNLWETYIDGKRPLPYTFELVSNGGDVKFYATIPNKFIYGFRDAMYSQYPGVELRTLDLDYTAEIPSDLENYAFMSFHMNKKKDPAIPIKTYIDFEMDKLPKEEEKVDPMTPMLEMLAGIRPDQQLWIQFLCVAHREKGFKLGQLKSEDSWEHTVFEKIDEIMRRDPKTKTGPTDIDGMPRITKGEQRLVENMERNVGKVAYEFACRVVYLSTDPTNYDGGLYSRFLRTFAQTEVIKQNGISMKWRTDFNYKWFSDPFYKIIPGLKKTELSEYKRRQLFPKTGGSVWSMMTAEELATIFHLPGRVAITPTLNRVLSTRSEAPSNLPTGNLPQ